MIRLDTLLHENRVRSKSDYFARGKNAWIFTSEQTKTADFIAKCLFRGKILRFFASENTMLEFLLIIGEFESVFVASEVAEKSDVFFFSTFCFLLWTSAVKKYW